MHGSQSVQDTQLESLRSHLNACNCISTRWLPFSIKPCDCEWRGLPLIIVTSPGHDFNISLITSLTNSLPLLTTIFLGAQNMGKPCAQAH